MFSQCPFCKNNEQDDFWINDCGISGGQQLKQVVCGYCGAKGPEATTERGAKMRWNKGLRRENV